jgi:hypothetical protein
MGPETKKNNFQDFQNQRYCTLVFLCPKERESESERERERARAIESKSDREQER